MFPNPNFSPESVATPIELVSASFARAARALGLRPGPLNENESSDLGRFCRVHVPSLEKSELDSLMRCLLQASAHEHLGQDANRRLFAAIGRETQLRAPLSGFDRLSAQSIGAMQNYIWDYLVPFIRYYKHVAPRRPLHILEIGGGDLEGARRLRELFSPCEARITVVDPRRDVPQESLRSLQVHHIAARASTLTIDDHLPPVDYMIAVRALEYERDLSRTFCKLSGFLAPKAQGLVVHNTVSSATGLNIKYALARYEARIVGFKGLALFLQGKMTLEDLRGSVLESLFLGNEDIIGDECEKFHRLSKQVEKLVKPENGAQVDAVIEHYRDVAKRYEDRRRQLLACYGEDPVGVKADVARAYGAGLRVLERYQVFPEPQCQHNFLVDLISRAKPGRVQRKVPPIRTEIRHFS